MITAEDVPAAAALYAAGTGLIALSKQFKTSTRKLRELLDEAGVTIRPRGRPRVMVPGSRRHKRALRRAAKG